MNNLMIDLETLGTKHTSIFLSLAAVQFDIHTGKIGDSFYSNVSLESAQRANLTWDTSTLRWWMSQNDEVRKSMFNAPEELYTVLEDFYNFVNRIKETAGEPKLWGNSASFDLGILGNAYDVMQMDRPWSFRNERCYRTISSEFRGLLREEIVNLKPHDPLSDCLYQIQKLVAIYRTLRGEGSMVADYGVALTILKELSKNESPAVARLSALAKEFLDGKNNGSKPQYEFEKP